MIILRVEVVLDFSHKIYDKCMEYSLFLIECSPSHDGGPQVIIIITSAFFEVATDRFVPPGTRLATGERDGSCLASG